MYRTSKLNHKFSLIAAAVLMACTMLLHPQGGSFEYIIQNAIHIKLAHAFAILSAPFLLFGFMPLCLLSDQKSNFSIFAFILLCISCIAAVGAAIINGFLIPQFLLEQSIQLSTHRSFISIIVSFAFCLNEILDWIFTLGLSLFVLCFALHIHNFWKENKWVSVVGFLSFMAFIICLLMGFSFINLLGLRIYIAILTCWIILVGLLNKQTS